MESPKAGLSEIGDTIREALETETDSPDAIRVARAELLHHVTTFAKPRSRWASIALRPMRVGALVAVFSATIAVWLWFGRAISFAVGERAAAGRIGDVVQAEGVEPLPLRFSEGSSVVLRGGSRARVLSADAGGARVLLENGEAEVAITHRTARATRWSFEAGSFHVLVTGTKFKVAWNAASQALSLATKEGSVLVSAPCLNAPRAVSAGSSVELTCGPKPLAAAAPRAGSAAPSASPEKGAGAPIVAPALARAVPRVRVDEGEHGAQNVDAFREALRKGQLAEALRAAEAAGFKSVCERANPEELLALADAARLSGSAGRAGETLLALRRRFPRAPESATAAFALGRIAFDQRADYAEAARWFQAYLDQQPNGPLLGDAAGRLLQARARGADRAAARSEAERYLARFPAGPYAAEARKILSE